MVGSLVKEAIAVIVGIGEQIAFIAEMRHEIVCDVDFTFIQRSYAPSFGNRPCCPNCMQFVAFAATAGAPSIGGVWVCAVNGNLQSFAVEGLEQCRAPRSGNALGKTM